MFYLEKVSFLHKVVNLYSPCQLQWYFKCIDPIQCHMSYFFCLYSENIRFKKKKTHCNSNLVHLSSYPYIKPIFLHVR